MTESRPDYFRRLSDAVKVARKIPGAKYAPVARQFEVSRDTNRGRVNGERPTKGKPATHNNPFNGQKGLFLTISIAEQGAALIF